MFVRDWNSSNVSSVYPAYDGNGNLTALVRAEDGTLAAGYEYSPYGELLTSTGDYAGKNPFRFSTKYTDSETGLAYFGYRYYNPDTGRWLNRDPIGEVGSQIVRRNIKVFSPNAFDEGFNDFEMFDDYNLNIPMGSCQIPSSVRAMINVDVLGKNCYICMFKISPMTISIQWVWIVLDAMAFRILLKVRAD